MSASAFCHNTLRQDHNPQNADCLGRGFPFFISLSLYTIFSSFNSIMGLEDVPDYACLNLNKRITNSQDIQDCQKESIILS